MRVSGPHRPMCALAVATAVGSGGCSPLVRLGLRFVLPSHFATGANALIDERFHIVGAKTCPVDEPRVEWVASPAEYFNDEFDKDEVNALVAFRGRHCAVRALGWYDTNGDGVPDAGDFEGATLVDAIDRGVFRGNVTSAPDVVLALVP